MPVAHRADVEPLFALHVALLEELLHDPVGPLSIQVEWLGRVAQVGAVNHIL